MESLESPSSWTNTNASKSVIPRTGSVDEMQLRPGAPTMPVWLINRATQTDCESDCNENVNEFPDSTCLHLTLERPKCQEHTNPTATEDIGSQTTSLTKVRKTSPVQIPRSTPLVRMRSSIEGLNQEIEKLVLHPGYAAAGRANRLDQVSALHGNGTPQTSTSPRPTEVNEREDDEYATGCGSPNQDTTIAHFIHLCSEDNLPSLSSHLKNVDCLHGLHDPLEQFDVSISTEASSPRNNRFMAQLQPGCERIFTKIIPLNEATSTLRTLPIVSTKPTAAFDLKPSQGSAFHYAGNAIKRNEEDLLPLEEDTSLSILVEAKDLGAKVGELSN